MEYGREEWETDSAAAAKEAARRVAIVAADETETSLFLSDLIALEMIPELTGCEHLQELIVGNGLAPDGMGFFVLERPIKDLTPLSAITGLQALHCSRTQVTDLTPLSAITGLQALHCSRTQVTDLTPLSAITGLQTLDCSRTQVTDLAPLSAITGLQALNCYSTQVTDLAPLSAITGLQTLDCSHMQVADLAPLSAITGLQTLDCSYSQVTDLAPLSAITGLQTLDCSGAQIADLAPLSAITGLQTLDCSYTQVTDLAPLSAITGLRTLHFSHMQVADLAPLSAITGLQTLNCPYTQVTDLSALLELEHLREFDCCNCSIRDAPIEFWSKESLRDVKAHASSIAGLPEECLSQGPTTNCLPNIRAHIADLGENPEPMEDIKLMVLGNGRIGKTQICNRLRGLDFEKQADSTHGITVTSAPISGGNGDFNIWDFGGQDIYHGTHALFLKSRAVFMLVWTPEAEAAPDHDHGGMTFRNQKLAWWVDYVRRYGSDSSPVIAVQNKQDEVDDQGEHPDIRALRESHGFCRSLAYSALTEDGGGALNDYLRQAARAFNPPLIGQGRRAVIDALRAMRCDDETRARDDKQHRTLSLTAFEQICTDIGGISDVRLFAQFLHNAGEVFWREDYFSSDLILDQAWVLDAIYTVFDREACVASLHNARGRFTRALLGMLVWNDKGYSPEEQRLFISFMASCGICFQVEHSNDGRKASYIAPDYLPLEWPDRDVMVPAEFEVTATRRYDNLPPALMRNVISRLGTQSGLQAHYWRNGLFGHDSETRAKAMIEQDVQPDWQGTITISATGGQPRELLARLVRIVAEEEGRLNLSPTEADEVPNEHRHDGEGKTRPEDPTLGNDPDRPKSWYVSYAWAGPDDDPDDNRETIVDEFCAGAAALGVTIQRDKTQMRLGDRISTFMAQLAEGDRIIVVLSEKYLQSWFCMKELYDIWTIARQRGAEFNNKVFVYTHNDAAIGTPQARAAHRRYWRGQYEDGLSDLNDMAGMDMLGHHEIEKFATHVADILYVASDTLRARDVSQLMQLIEAEADAPCGE